MAIIKLVNEENGEHYDTKESVQNLIDYIMAGYKTLNDQIRAGYCFGDYIGCTPFLGIHEQQKDSFLVASQMLANNQAYNKTTGNLMKHRIISFDNYDCVLPQEADELARHLANAYGENYITAYAVHLDTNNIHIHLAIDTISWCDGSRFSKSFEKRWLSAMVYRWENARDRYMIDNPEVWEKCQEYYGV